MTAVSKRDLMAIDWGRLVSESQNASPDTTVAIIGVVFGAICMGIKFGRAGLLNTTSEKASNFGGDRTEPRPMATSNKIRAAAK